MAQTLKFGNKVWAAKEDSVLAYNDINNNYKPLPFSFSRASIGTRVNKAGLIETMGQDIARIDYTDSADGVLLLEPASTNLYPYSQYYGAGGLEVVGIGTQTHTITNNYSISPDGTQNAIRFQATVGNTSSDRVILRDAITSATVDSTISVYAKSNTTSNYTMIFHYEGGTRDTFIVTSEWQRFSFSEVSIAINNAGIELKGDVTSLEADVSLWGFQFENQSYPTSVIPTSGSTVTRAAETCNNSGNSEVFNDSEGVFFANIAALANDGTNRSIAISGGSGNNKVEIRYSLQADNRIRYIVRSGDVTQVDISNTNTNLSNALLYNKILVTYKLNDFSIWLNGFKADTDATGLTPVGLSQLDFDRGDSQLPFYGKTKELGYYDTALTDLELETLTSYRNWVSMVNELNLNIIYNG